MAPNASARRVLVTHAGPEAFVSMTPAILSKLGYEMVDADAFESRAGAPNYERPDLLLVDERRLAEVPDDGGPPVPIIALSGRHGVTGADPRIAGAIRRPAGLHEIYRVAQQLLEDMPRATPRVPTHLSARCHREGREWLAVVLSLSENGCLLRSPEPLLLGSRIEIRFELPARGEIHVRAEVGYQLVPDFGIVFNATTPDDRRRIRDYVIEALTPI